MCGPPEQMPQSFHGFGRVEFMLGAGSPTLLLTFYDRAKLSSWWACPKPLIVRGAVTNLCHSAEITEIAAH
jgi:hypothetical protein